MHKKMIASCIYDSETGAILDERELPHDLLKIRKYLRKVQDHHGMLRSCYEASSCEFGLQHILQANGISCDVVSSSSIPRRSWDGLKTDRRYPYMCVSPLSPSSISGKSTTPWTWILTHSPQKLRRSDPTPRSRSALMDLKWAIIGPWVLYEQFSCQSRVNVATNGGILGFIRRFGVRGA